MNPTDRITALTIDCDAANDIRSLLIDIDDDDMQSLNAADRTAAIALIESLDRDTLTELLLDHSLCPLHAIDYAICFDDDDPTCAQIRAIHPSHDT